MKKKTLFLSYLATCLVFASTVAIGVEAQTENPKSPLMQWLEGDYLLGDWGGGRKSLSEHGIDFEAIYFGAIPSNLKGGIKTGSVYQGLLLGTLDINTEKLVNWKGGHFHGGVVYTHGQQFSQTYVGDLNVVSLIDFPDQFYLWELWYEQTFPFFYGQLSLKVGQLAVDQDFIVPEYYNALASINFLNQTFFFPTVAFNIYDVVGFPAGNHALPSTPYGAPGARLRWDIVPQFYAQAAIYDGNPDQTYSGTSIDLNSDEGVLMYYELGYRHNQGEKDTGLPGNFKLGGYYHTDYFLDLGDYLSTAYDPLVPPTTVYYSGNYGLYFLADHMLYREKGKDDPAQQGLTGFFRTAWAPPDRNLFEFGIDGGLVYRGLIPGRDWDTLGLAGSYLKISDDFQDAQREVNEAVSALGVPPPLTIADYEAVIELNYKLQMTAWWTFQPSLQWVIHPGGSTATPNALVLIFQNSIRF